jgi:hypothetical protein
MWVWIVSLYVVLLDLWNLKLVIFFFPFLWILFLGAHKDLRLDHNEDKFRPNNTPDWHFFCLMDQIPERRRSYWEVQAGSS